MKVLLINPPVKNAIRSELPGFISGSSGNFPPLGLLYIESFIQARPGFEVRLLDYVSEYPENGSIEEAVKRFMPDLVGITANMHNLCDCLDTAGTVKSVSGDTHICLGGPFPTVMGRDSVHSPFVDSSVIGEGEFSFFELSDALGKGGGLSSVKGIVYKEGGAVRINASREPVSDLDVFPFPSRRPAEESRYFHALSSSSIATTMITSRGCPYDCAFCVKSTGRYRYRSIRNVMEEIKICLGLGYDEIHFIDDSFNVSKERFMDLCRSLREAGHGLRWSFRGRGDMLTPDMLYSARESGCARIHIGIETWDVEGLVMLNKKLDLLKIKETVSLCRRLGIDTAAYFLIGCPHEKSTDDIRRDVDRAIVLDPDFAMFNVLALYPGTSLFSSAIKRGLLEPGIWEDYARQPYRDFRLPFWEENIGRKELLGSNIMAYVRFYLRAGYIWRVLSSRRKLLMFFRNIRAALLLVLFFITGSRAVSRRYFA